MKKRMCFTTIMLLLIMLSINALAKSAEGEIKYKEHDVYVSGYIDFLNGPIPLLTTDKVWARATFYGADAWYVVSASEGASVICRTSKGEEVFNRILTATNNKVSVSEVAINRDNTYATLTLKILADSNNTKTLKATD